MLYNLAYPNRSSYLPPTYPTYLTYPLSYLASFIKVALLTSRNGKSFY